MSIFEKATRQKLRFQSDRGDLTVEQLWDLRLIGGVGSLDSVARSVNTELKSVTEESFVETTVNPLRDVLELKLEVVKHIIAVKKQEHADRLASYERSAEIEKLQSILVSKNDEALKSLSPEEIQARIASLKAPATVS